MNGASGINMPMSMPFYLSPVSSFAPGRSGLEGPSNQLGDRVQIRCGWCLTGLFVFAAICSFRLIHASLQSGEFVFDRVNSFKFGELALEAIAA